MSWAAAGLRALCCTPGVLQECLAKQHFQVNRECELRRSQLWDWLLSGREAEFQLCPVLQVRESPVAVAQLSDCCEAEVDSQLCGVGRGHKFTPKMELPVLLPTQD